MRGIAVALLGLMLLTRTAATVTALVWLMGIYWLVDGVFVIIESIRGRKSNGDWGFGVFVGFISVLAGIIVFSRPLVTAAMGATFFVYLVAFMVVFSGIGSIATGFRLRKEIDNEWSMILGGGLSVIFGLVLMMNPLMSAAILAWTVGGFALVGGIFLIVQAFKIRKVGQEGLAAVLPNSDE